MNYPRVNILGTNISAVDMPMALATIGQWIEDRTPRYCCCVPVNSIMQGHDDDTLRAIFNQAGLVTPDGMPLVWLTRFQGHDHVRRVYGPDLMLALCEHSLLHGYRHFFYGGEEGVAARLATTLRLRFPGLQFAGVYSPPFRELSPAEDDEIIEQINATRPDIVWVGLGAPKQEYWMATHVGRLTAPALIGVGAAFDFHAGRKRQAPRWMQRSGLEWVFRFASEPRRLWRRYAINNPRFIYGVVMQMTGLRRYPI